MGIKFLLFPLLLRPSSEPVKTPLPALKSPDIPAANDFTRPEQPAAQIELQPSAHGHETIYPLAPIFGDSLPPNVQAHYEKLGGTDDALLTSLVESSAFSGPLLEPNTRKVPSDLSKADRQIQLLYLLGGKNPYSRHIQEICKTRLDANQDYPQVWEYIIEKDILEANVGWSDYPMHVASVFTNSFSSKEPKPYELDGPVEGKTSSNEVYSSTSANVFTMSVANKVITLKHAAGDIGVNRVAEAIARLPSSTLGLLDTIELHGRFKNFGGQVVNDTVILLHTSEMNGSMDNIAETLVHEAGHVLFHWSAGTSEGRAWEALAWVTSMARDRIKPSKYAFKAFNEDMAEFYHLYLQAEQHEFLHELAFMFPDRFRIMHERINKHGPFQE